MARGTCASVNSRECEAPAGYRTGHGVAALPQRTGLLVCSYCEETVCRSCAVNREGLDLCPDHHEDELDLLLEAARRGQLTPA